MNFLKSRFAALAPVFLAISPGPATCDRSKSAAPPASTQPASVSGPAAQQMSIDDLVAPVALYPDLLVTQILTTATNPQQVLDGGNWLIKNQGLQADALDDAANKADLSPSMQYLVHFPQVLDQMWQQMDWTRQLGQAFQTNQKAVLDAVQGKRAHGQQMGNLSATPQRIVSTGTNNGQQAEQITPTDPKLVYVPQCNPVTTYNTPAPSASTQSTTASAQTTASPEQKSGVSTGTAVVASLFSFGVGVAVGAAISNHNDTTPTRHGLWRRVLCRTSLLPASLSSRPHAELPPGHRVLPARQLSLESVQPQRQRQQQLLRPFSQHERERRIERNRCAA